VVAEKDRRGMMGNAGRRNAGIDADGPDVITTLRHFALALENMVGYV